MRKYILIISGTFVISCSNSEVKKEYLITDFTKPIIDTLSPIKDEAYISRFIHVKGYVDDSIYVSYGEGSSKIYLQKDIDTVFSYDYYGGPDAIFVFDPYKAKIGKLEVKFSIQ